MAKEFKGHFECLGENTEKYINFSVPTEKQLENGKTVTYKIKFIHSVEFMATSLSSLIRAKDSDNPAEGLHNSKCKEFKSCYEYIKVRNKSFMVKCLKYHNNH